MVNPDSFLIDGASGGRARLILAHGAGAPMDSEFMAQFAMNLADLSIEVVRFEFPYMVQRRLTGSKRPPNRQPELLASWHAVYRYFSSDQLPLYIGGKSLGGRMATVFAAQLCPPELCGVICLGYPFHPPAKPEKLRTGHLIDMQTPCLIIQGQRDAFGRPDEVAQFGLAKKVELTWLESADHDFRPLKATGLTQHDCIMQAARWTAEYMLRHPKP